MWIRGRQGAFRSCRSNAVERIDKVIAQLSEDRDLRASKCFVAVSRKDGASELATIAFFTESTMTAMRCGFSRSGIVAKSTVRFALASSRHRQIRSPIEQPAPGGGADPQWRERKGRVATQEGHILRGPRLVSRPEFNRLKRSDGIGFTILQPPSRRERFFGRDPGTLDGTRSAGGGK